LAAGFVLAPLLLVISIATAAFLSGVFAAMLAVYFLASLAYSLSLKRIVLLDVFVLSGLYTFRIVTGHLLTDIQFSEWLLSFAFFLFLSLAFSKRWAELNNVSKTAGKIEGRGYEAGDLSQVNVFGVCSGFLSAVVFILYLQSERVRQLYRQPQFLWLLAPVYLYWISRVWVLCSRGQMHEDPIVFVLKDRVFYALTAVCGLIMLAAARGW
jgi:4-hydroxybenzoate polyprenyltransferase